VVGVSTRRKVPKPTLANITIALAVASAALFLVGIWSGDARWAQTATVALVPGIVGGLVWVVKQVWNAGV
jgi:hypothetical protein